MSLSTTDQMQLLKAAGIPVTTTKPASGYWVEWAPGIYTPNQSDKLGDPYHGLTAAQYQLAASIVDPYLNPTALAGQLQQAGVSLTGTVLANTPTTPPTGTTTATGTGSPAGAGHHPGATAPPPAPTGSGFTPFSPTAAVPGTSGALDPNQPFGEGFGSDYGLNPGADPNFAFGSGSTAPPPPTATTTAGAPSGTTTPTGPNLGNLVTAMNAQLSQFIAGTGPKPSFFDQLPDAEQKSIHQLRQQLSGMQDKAQAIEIAQKAVTSLTANTNSGTGSSGTAGSGGSGSGTGSSGTGGSGNQDALTDLKSILNTYGLGDMADWAWGEIVAGKSEQQVLLDLMKTPQFKARFPAIDARAKAGLPPISPGDYVNYENQATQMMRAAGLPSGFWDSPGDFTHLLASDVSISELSQRLNLATQAAYQVPADVRASLARDYGVGPGQLAAFFLDDKTALPLIQRDFTAAQIGGAAYRTGYGSTKTEDERLTDLGVNPGQAQQGFNQLTLQRQLFSSLPGENTTGISRGDQLGATFAGDALAQQKVVRRAQERVAVFSQGGGFTQSQDGFTLGASRSA